MPTSEVSVLHSNANDIINSINQWHNNNTHHMAVALGKAIEAYFEKLNLDVNKSWFVKPMPLPTELGLVSKLMESEFNELNQEFLRLQEGRLITDSAKRVRSEIVDALYYLVKLKSLEEINIADYLPRALLDSKYWNVLHNETREQLITRLISTADYITFVESCAEDKHNPSQISPYHQSATIAPYVANSILIIFRLAEIEKIDLEMAWNEKMEENAKRDIFMRDKPA